MSEGGMGYRWFGFSSFGEYASSLLRTPQRILHRTFLRRNFAEQVTDKVHNVDADMKKVLVSIFANLPY
jgi:hypothetical protein